MYVMIESRKCESAKIQLSPDYFACADACWHKIRSNAQNRGANRLTESVLE